MKREIDKVNYISGLAQKMTDLVIADHPQDDYNEVMQKIEENFTDISKIEKVEKRIASIDIEASSKILMIKLTKSRRHKFRTVRVIRYASMTVAAMLAIAIVMFYGSQNTSFETNIVAEDISYTVPTIILADGSSVELKKSQPITDNNNPLVVKDSESTVVYSRTRSSVSDTIKNMIVVPKGYSYSIVLSDGSKVRLNSGSTLEYPICFTSNERRVKLTGEAYFDVEHHISSPFIVEARQMEIKVYGTQFNVAVRDSRIEALLVEGSIGATIDNKESILEPNQMITYMVEDASSEVRNVNSFDYTGWLNDEFFYSDRDIYMVLSDLSNWYGVKFRYDNKMLGGTKVSFYASRSSTIEEIIKIVELSADMLIINEGGGNYTIEENN